MIVYMLPLARGQVLPPVFTMEIVTHQLRPGEPAKPNLAFTAGVSTALTNSCN